MKYKVLPGINIQWPWSELLINGKKTIETRSYKLPESIKNVEIAIIETPGRSGKKNGMVSSRIVGTIIFVDSHQYTSKKSWASDYERHLVNPDDSQFSYKKGKPKWGWVVGRVSKFKSPVPPPSKRGIVFAKHCKVPLE